MFWKFGTAGTAAKGTEGEGSGFGGKVNEVSISIASGEEGACLGYTSTMINK